MKLKPGKLLSLTAGTLVIVGAAIILGLQSETNEKPSVSPEMQSVALEMLSETSEMQSETLEMLFEESERLSETNEMPSNTNESATTDSGHTMDFQYRYISNMRRFDNGLTIVKYGDDLFDGRKWDIINAKGEIISPTHSESSSIFAFGDECFMIYEDNSSYMVHQLGDGDSYVLFDMAGNRLLNIPADRIISAPSEGLFYVDDYYNKNHEERTITYYNEKGVEVLSIRGYASSTLSSQFTGGRAIICKISDRGFDTDWTLIDIYGNKKLLSVKNLEKIYSSSFLDALKDKSTELAELGFVFDVDSCTVNRVYGFQPGEKYAVADVVLVLTYTDKWNFDERLEIHVLSRIDRQGNVYLTNWITYGEIAPCINDCVIIDDTLIVNIETEKGFDITEIPIINGLKKEYDIYFKSGFKLYPMTDGNYFVTIDGSSTIDRCDYMFIVSPEGTVVEGPVIGNKETTVYYDDLDWSDITFPYNPWNEFNRSRPTVLSRNMLYLAMARIESEEYLNYLKTNTNFAHQIAFGYSDIWGNIVISPQYIRATSFSEGKALVCTGVERLYNSYQQTNDMSIIYQPNYVAEPKPVLVDNFNCDKIEDEYSVNAIRQAVQTLMETSPSYQSVMNSKAVLPVGVGESLGYLYDVATFDVSGLINHIISDATHEYRSDAANVIIMSLLGKVDIDEYNVNQAALKDFAQTQEFRSLKTSQQITDKLISYLYRINPNDDVLWYTKHGTSFINKLLKGISSLGEYIDKIEASNEEKLVILLLTSNYQTNIDYLNDCIKSCENDNSEMEEIYRTALKEIEMTYKEYIESTAVSIKGSYYFEIIFSDETINNIDWVLDANDISVSGGLKSAFAAGLKKQGMKDKVAKELAEKQLRGYLAVHSLVVKFAEVVHTGDTYTLMQRLYENAIVVNAMVNELSNSIADGTPLEEQINKAIALGKYRLIMMANLQELYRVHWSARQTLTVEKLGKEKTQLRYTVNWLENRP